MDNPMDDLDLLAALRLDAEILRLVAEVDEFKGRWQALGRLAPDRLSALRRVATIESIGSSTRIEGARLSDAQVDQLLSGLDVRSFRSRDEQEVAGYAEAMELVFESWRELTLTENHIKQLHAVLLKFSEKDERHRGEHKALPNHVEAFDDNGKSLGVIFQTATPFDTPRMMKALVSATRTALDAKADHPLLVIAAFVVRFLAIHPFQDGNGRLSRILTSILLLRAGYSYVPYSSLERIVEENKDDYYRALRKAQASQSELAYWVRFFLRCLVQQKSALTARIEREQLMAPLAPLSAKLLSLARQHGRITVAQATKATRSNRNTIKWHLRKLVEAGQLVRRGEARGSFYELT
jgi:Fic family protein